MAPQHERWAAIDLYPDQLARWLVELNQRGAQRLTEHAQRLAQLQRSDDEQGPNIARCAPSFSLVGTKGNTSQCQPQVFKAGGTRMC